MHTTITIDINGHLHDLHTHELTGAQIKALGHHEHGTLFRLDGGERHLSRTTSSSISTTTNSS